MDICELDDHKIRVLRSDEWCGKEFVWPIEHSDEIERCRSMGKSYGMDANGKHLIHMCDVDTELRCSESDVSVVCPKMGESVGDGLGSVGDGLGSVGDGLGSVGNDASTTLILLGKDEWCGSLFNDGPLTMEEMDQCRTMAVSLGTDEQGQLLVHRCGVDENNKCVVQGEIATNRSRLVCSRVSTQTA